MRSPQGQPAGRVLAACSAAAVVILGGVACTSPSTPAAGPSASASPASLAPGESGGGGSPALAGGPASPPARVCGNQSILGNGPAKPPRGSVVIPAGNDSGTVLANDYTIKPHTTYWFAAGTHYLAGSPYSQIIPADGDTFIGAPGAVIDGRHRNLFAFTQQARDVTIRYLTIQNFGKPGDSPGQGVVNHDEGPGWHLDHLTIQDSAGAGAMVGTGDVLAWSCLKDNGEYGLQGGGSHITVDHNEVVGNNTDNWEARQPGCGCSGGAKFWSVDGAAVTGNYVHDNHGPGLWADTNNRGFDIAGNYIADNEGEGFIYEISYNLRLADNTFIRNALVDGPSLPGFPDPAVYISESGGDSRVPGRYSGTIEITGNAFTDNWSGVVLWESADRFCGSPDNTSASYCTLVNPKVTTLHSCNARTIARPPYFSDCRWKTQNVLVSGNKFVFRPADIGPSCTDAKYCGFNGIFSQFGTDPAWSPYHGRVVENDITFDQNNHFRSNSYVGPWNFVVHQQGNAVSWARWRTSPTRQDAGSTLASS